MIVEEKTTTEFVEKVPNAHVAQVIRPEDLSGYLVPDDILEATGSEGVAVLTDEKVHPVLFTLLNIPMLGVAFEPLRDFGAYTVSLADLPRGVSEGDQLSVSLSPALVDGLEERGRYVEADVLLHDVQEWSV